MSSWNRRAACFARATVRLRRAPAAESFFAKLKTELDAKGFGDRFKASRDVFDCFERKYNSVFKASRIGFNVCLLGRDRRFPLNISIKYHPGTIAMPALLVSGIVGGLIFLPLSFKWFSLYLWVSIFVLSSFILLMLGRWLLHALGSFRLSRPCMRLDNTGLHVYGSTIPWNYISEAEYWLAGEILITIKRPAQLTKQANIPPQLPDEIERRLVPGRLSDDWPEPAPRDALRVACWGLDRSPHEIVDLINKARSIYAGPQ